MKKNYIKAAEFDKKFDDGERISNYIDKSSVKRNSLQVKRINISLPEWMLKSLDTKAKKLGISRQSVIKKFVAEKLKTG